MQDKKIRRKMRKKLVSVVIFKKGEKILIQDRRPWDRYKVDYGFFGGKIEKGETPEQTLKREIKEELDINIINFKFFKHTKKNMPKLDLEVEYYLFLAPIPDIDKITCSEGKPVLTNIQTALKSKMTSGDHELLKEVYENQK